jgi:hypothetical protein
MKELDDVLPDLNERGLRFFAAREAQSAGYGGIAAVSWATERPAADAIVRQPQQTGLTLTFRSARF